MNLGRSRWISAILLLGILSWPAAAQSGQAPEAAGKAPSAVYFTRRISPEAMIALYKAMGRDLPGKVAVKLSTGEPGGSYYLSPNLIKDLVHSVNGTIVECNTAYPGKRTSTAMHRQVAVDHGFAAIADVDIMDADGEMSIPVPKGSHLQEDIVGSHLANYDSMLVLSHFKGHQMGGFGGALKNISIGVASSGGKLFIHSGGAMRSGSFFRVIYTNQDVFVESMAEAASAVAARMGKNIVYINVMNNLSIDCDCDSHPAKPELDDIGILASTDPVALDRACVDLIYKSDEAKSASLRQRIEAKHGTLILKHAEEIGMGVQAYKLVPID